MYKFLAYEWPMDWEAIDVDHIVDIAIKTQCQMCTLDFNLDERNFLSIVFGFAYQSIESLSSFIQASGFRKGRWSPISQEQFLSGNPLYFSEQESDKANSYFQFHKYQFNLENNDFHHRLKTTWKNWPVFKVDWSTKFIYDMTSDEKDVVRRTWQNMFQDAQMLGSLLGFVTLVRTPRVRRLFLPLPFYELLPRYIEQVAPHLPLSEWSLIERKEIPNLIRTHSWRPGLTVEIE